MVEKPSCGEIHRDKSNTRKWLLLAGSTAAWLGGVAVAMNEAPQNNDDTNYYLFTAGAAANTLGILGIIFVGPELMVSGNKNEEESQSEESQFSSSPHF